MKRALVLSLLMLAVLSAVAFAGPGINPYFEIENVGITAQPTLEAGVTLEGDLWDAWAMDLGFNYVKDDIFAYSREFDLNFEASIWFDQYATVNETGGINYGCSFAFYQGAGYRSNYPISYVVLGNSTTGFMLEGYVGPLTLWGGAEWSGITSTKAFSPTLGMRVDFNIDL